MRGFTGLKYALGPTRGRSPWIHCAGAIYDCSESERIADHPIGRRARMTVLFSPTGAAMVDCGQRWPIAPGDAAQTGGGLYGNTNGLALAPHTVLGHGWELLTLSYTPHD